MTQDIKNSSKGSHANQVRYTGGQSDKGRVTQAKSKNVMANTLRKSLSTLLIKLVGNTQGRERAETRGQVSTRKHRKRRQKTTLWNLTRCNTGCIQKNYKI